MHDTESPVGILLLITSPEIAFNEYDGPAYISREMMIKHPITIKQKLATKYVCASKRFELHFQKLYFMKHVAIISTTVQYTYIT